MPGFAPDGPDAFYAEFFGSLAARKGQIIRRKARDVERFVGRVAFLREMHRRGFTVAENAGQFVVFCNHELIQIHEAHRRTDADFRPEIGPGKQTFSGKRKAAKPLPTRHFHGGPGQGRGK